jgi:hypothetical protein
MAHINYVRPGVLGILFPVRPNKLGKIKGVDTCLLLRRISEGEIATVLEVPESGVVHTKQWTGERWRARPRCIERSVLTYASI